VSEARKVIVTCAVTGSVHSPSFSEHLPITPEEIAEQAIEAVEAGASILHLHARDPDTGRPTADPEVFERIVTPIRRATDAVLNISTGGGGPMTLDQRMAAARELRPELASLNMGSMNFGLFPLVEREREWLHDWERPRLANTKDLVFKNTFADIEQVVGTLAPLGVRFEFECFDVGHLHNLAHVVREGLVEPPFFVQTVFGVLGGIGVEVENLAHQKRMIDRLFAGRYEWTALGPGRHQLNMATMSALMGGNVRVGLEDSIYLGRGRLARSNAEQVTAIRNILEALSFEIATPADVRRKLELSREGALT
jgi:uncharacterized protein (DUF849 family)